MKKLLALFLSGIICIASQVVLAEKKKKLKTPEKKKISVLLKSGITLVGTFYEPREAKNLSFVLLHGLGSSKEEWLSFADKLHTIGYGVFIYDARGHGESTEGVGGNEIDYKLFPRFGKNTPWKLMIDDLEEVLVYLEKIEGMDKDRFVLGGASLGANVVLTCAARKKNIRGLMLLSPGLDYAGIQTEYPMRFCKVPAIAIASASGDTYSYNSSVKLIACKSRDINTYMSSVRLESFVWNEKKITFFSQIGNGHGVNMFKRGLDGELLEWIQKKVKHK